ncbi:copper homeostasis protein CutC [Salegentibacter sp. F14]
MNNFIKEACVENINQALKAEKNGANRIELCGHLNVGGMTPSNELIVAAKQQLKIPIRIMIRPRGGNFVYSKEEFETMVTSIEFCKKIGVEGVVFGILDTANFLNLKEISTMAKIASPLKVVIHKAIDETPKPIEEVKKLSEIEGITTVLTSGGEKTAFEGKEVLREMISICQDQMELLPAGKITNKNIQELHNFLGAKAYHGKRIVGNLT